MNAQQDFVAVSEDRPRMVKFPACRLRVRFPCYNLDILLDILRNPP